MSRLAVLRRNRVLRELRVQIDRRKPDQSVQLIRIRGSEGSRRHVTALSDDCALPRRRSVHGIRSQPQLSETFQVGEPVEQISHDDKERGLTPQKLGHVHSVADVGGRRKVIVHIAASADGYIARSDDDLDWLTSRPKPRGFYGMGAFMKSVDTMLLGRKTYEVGLRLGGTFDPKKGRTFVFSRHAPPADAPAGVEFVSGAIGPFVKRLREEPGKDIWLMGGGDLIASFLDERAIDEFVVSVVPVFIGDGIPLIARRHRHVPLALQSVERFEDGLVQLRYSIQSAPEESEP